MCDSYRVKTMVTLPAYLQGCLILSLSLLMGCNMVKLAYTNADYFLLSYVDGYLDLTSAQKDYLRDRLTRRLEEHRREELLQAVEFLRFVKRSAVDGLSPREIDALSSSAKRLYDTTVTNTIPVFTSVLTKLSNQQIKYLKQELKERNKEFRSKYLQEDHDERLEARLERTLKRIKKWIGSVSNDQRKMIVDIMRIWPDMAPDWYEYRLARQRGLLELLETKAPALEVEGYLIGWFVQQSGQTQAMRVQTGRLQQGLKMLLLALNSSLSEKQQVYFLKRIDDFSSDLAALIIPAV